MPAPASHPRSPRISHLRALCVLTLLTTAFSAAIHPQGAGPSSQDAQSQSQPMPPIRWGGPKDEPDRIARIAMAKRLSVERQKQMAASTDRLLGLARELASATSQAESGPKHNAGQSAASAKKAEEIAKLARTIREKMSEDYSQH